MSQQTPAKGEEPLATKTFNQWKGVNTQSTRNTQPQDTWAYLENMQPIGDGNILTVNNLGPLLVSYSTDIVYWAQYINIGGVDYIISFSTSGKVFAYNIASNTSTTISTGLSGSGSRVAQWKNTQALFIDSSGYYNWPGTGTLTLISGTGVPTSGNDIAVAFDRVWIAQGRLITFSGADDFSAASFTVANGAGSEALVDPTLRSTVVRLIGFNGYLYVIGNTSINAISDLYVPSGANPPTPLYTNTNLQAIIGSDQPGSFFPMNRSLMFANRYGAWALNGVNAERVSADIDGTWKYVNFSQNISGGQLVSNNIICSAFLIKRLNDPTWGSNTVLAMYHDKKWWFANFGNLTYVVSAIANNQPTLYGFINNSLYQLFEDPTTAPATILQTPLWPMEDNLADKQVLRIGFEVTITVFAGTFSMTVDTVNSSQQAVSLQSGGNVAWQNNSGAIVQWQNNSLTIVYWFSGSYLLYNSVSPGVYGKYVGATIRSSASAYQFSAVDIDYKLGARWS